MTESYFCDAQIGELSLPANAILYQVCVLQYSAFLRNQVKVGVFYTADIYQGLVVPESSLRRWGSLLPAIIILPAFPL